MMRRMRALEERQLQTSSVGCWCEGFHMVQKNTSSDSYCDATAASIPLLLLLYLQSAVAELALASCPPPPRPTLPPSSFPHSQASITSSPFKGHLRGISPPSLTFTPTMSRVLTRRQQWRRVKHEKSTGSELFRTVDFSRPTLQESQSDTNVSLSKLFDSSLNLFRSVSAPGRSSMTVPIRRKKSVSFETAVVRVILIPTRQEMTKCLMDDPIWWSTDDYILFKTEALEELRELMSRHAHLDPKMASRLLYQPEYDVVFDELVSNSQRQIFRCLERPEEVNSSQHDVEAGYC